MPFNSIPFKTTDQAVHTLPEMNLVEDKLHRVLAGPDNVMTPMGIHLLSAGGKRIRPMLAVCAGRCFSPLTPEMVTAAASVELIHMASLVHDDVIDHSPTRRGKPSLNALWGNHPAVLAGDYLFAKAFGLLASSGLVNCLNLLVETIEDMCQGEIQQAVTGFDPDITEEEYLERIHKKTAVLLAASCKLGGLAAGAEDNILEALGEYGRSLGLAYQIIDDILDLTGQSAVMGKPSGQDLSLGNITLPIIMLLRDRKHVPLLETALAGRPAKILEALHSSGALLEARKRAQAHAEKAKASLSGFPASPYKDILQSLPDIALNRTS